MKSFPVVLTQIFHQTSHDQEQKPAHIMQRGLLKESRCTAEQFILHIVLLSTLWLHYGTLRSKQWISELVSYQTAALCDIISPAEKI